MPCSTLRLQTKFVIATLILVLLSVHRAFAFDAITKDPQNAHWHLSEKTLTATFLGSDKAEPAILILDKRSVVGMTLSIETDGNYIFLQSGTSPHVVSDGPAKQEGAVCKIQLLDSDPPSLFFNGKEQVQQQGKWIQILASTDKTIRMEIGPATFAKVKFEPAVAVLNKPAVVVAAPPVDPKGVKAAAVDKELLHNVTASQLSAVSAAFCEGVSKKCVGCGGTGKINVQVQTGTRAEGIYSVPVFENREEQCKKCHGNGIDRATDAALIRLAGNMVKDLAQIKIDDPKKQDAMTKAYATITDKIIDDQKTWTLLTAEGKSILAQQNPQVGSSVVSLVEVKKSFKLGDDHRRYLVRVIGTDRQVFVDDPALADELESGHALMGGIVTDPIANDNGKGHTTTLHGGFLVSPTIDHAYWWWYKDKD